MNAARLTKAEGISIILVGLLFVAAGSWALWRIHPVLSVVLTALFIWLLAIYHRKVCFNCPHTHCPSNPAFWGRPEGGDLQKRGPVGP